MKLNSSSFKFVFLLFILVLWTQISTLKQLMTLKWMHRKMRKKRKKRFKIGLYQSKAKRRQQHKAEPKIIQEIINITNKKNRIGD